MMTVMMTMMGQGYDEDPYLFHIRFKSPVRADWRCRGCVVIIIIMTVWWMMITVMMTMMGHGHDEDPYLFHIRFKSPLERIGDAEGA